MTQLGTMTAVLLYFRDDLARIARAWLRSLRDPAARRDHDARLGWYIILGTIPIGIFGLAFKDQIENGARDLYLIGTALIVLGFVLLAAERVGKQERQIEDIDATRRHRGSASRRRWRSFRECRDRAPPSRPGSSSASTAPAAARFSFLLSIPAVVLSGLLEFASILNGSDGQHAGLGALAVATFLAFVVGYASIAFLLRYLSDHSTIVFVVYRVALGIARAPAREHRRDQVIPLAPCNSP